MYGNEMVSSGIGRTMKNLERQEATVSWRGKQQGQYRLIREFSSLASRGQDRHSITWLPIVIFVVGYVWKRSQSPVMLWSRVELACNFSWEHTVCKSFQLLISNTQWSPVGSLKPDMMGILVVSTPQKSMNAMSKVFCPRTTFF